MNFILFDDFARNNLLPLTFLRPVADIRIGILTIREKWEKYLNVITSSLTEDYLSVKYPLKRDHQNVLINGSVCPTPVLVDEILALKPEQALVKGDVIIAFHIYNENIDSIDIESSDASQNIETSSDPIIISNLWDIFSRNGEALIQDFSLLTRNRVTKPLSSSNKCTNPDQVFIEDDANIEHAIINASSGPVYIGKHAEIMEGSMIRGPFALCEFGQIKMGAKIYGPTTIGPHCRVGGEVNNSVFLGYSNKAHDGFLGNSVIGEWCNIGADSNNSNLKNTYDEVRLWNYPQRTFVPSGLQFCGLIMGDHSKCGINTMFNTGTVVGVNASIFGPGFPRNFIPSFSWGGASGLTTFELKKAISVAERVYERRNKTFDQTEKDILTHVFRQTFIYRK